MGPGGFALLVASTDLRPPRGLPARSPSAPRASLGASARSPARPRRPCGGLQSVGVSVCCLAWPRRLWAPQPGPPVTSGALHAGGAFVADVAGASARCSARTRRLEACQILSFACNSPETLSNHELTTLELQRFQTLLKLLPIELHARFGWRWCRRFPRVPRPGPVGQVAGCLKPLSPLLAGACVGLKPPSPLRVRNGRFWCSFRVQR